MLHGLLTFTAAFRLSRKFVSDSGPENCSSCQIYW